MNNQNNHIDSDRIRKRKQKQERKARVMAEHMRRKLGYLLVFLVFCLLFLAYRLFAIVRDHGDEYNRKILTQQHYSSKTLPYRRGDIIDKNGTILATDEKVYNVILDTVAMNKKEEYVTATVNALVRHFKLDANEIKDYAKTHPESRYKVLAKELPFSEIEPFMQLLSGETKDANVQGVWFEDVYIRKYPYHNSACDVIGFTNRDNEGMYGLEEYYNTTLSGTNGREYGYLNNDSELERTTIPAKDGYTLVSTLDMNIQRIVEKNIKKFNDEHKNEFREGEGSYNTGCIIMEADTGNILAMASYPDFDLNDPYNLTALYTEEQVQELKDTDTYYSTLNKLWRNFCISDTYEPGSVAKPFTVAAGIDSGKLSGNETYDCHGTLNVNGTWIGCHNRYGDGVLTTKEAVEKSCNVSLMHMAATMGKPVFLKYFEQYGFGYKTNIDLAGEARTDSLVFHDNTMGPVELATSSFGQGFNVTMIQMISGFTSLVNGGYYYEPHMVSSIQTADGAVVLNVTPRVLKQTISEETSAVIRDYCEGVVLNGTGKNARPAGYIIGGKTGTAETVQNGKRDKKNYVVSFMGFAPVDDPQIVIYVVVDRPNVQYQDNATRYATFICRDVLTEVLPYLGIYMTEEVTEEEQKQLDELGIYVPQVQKPEEDGEETGATKEAEETEQEDEEGKEGQSSDEDETSESE